MLLLFDLQSNLFKCTRRQLQEARASELLQNDPEKRDSPTAERSIASTSGGSLASIFSKKSIPGLLVPSTLCLELAGYIPCLSRPLKSILSDPSMRSSSESSARCRFLRWSFLIAASNSFSESSMTTSRVKRLTPHAATDLTWWRSRPRSAGSGRSHETTSASKARTGQMTDGCSMMISRERVRLTELRRDRPAVTLKVDAQEET